MELLPQSQRTFRSARLEAVLWLLLLRGYGTRWVRPPRYPLGCSGWGNGVGSTTLPRYPTPRNDGWQIRVRRDHDASPLFASRWGRRLANKGEASSPSRVYTYPEGKRATGLAPRALGLGPKRATPRGQQKPSQAAIRRLPMCIRPCRGAAIHFISRSRCRGRITWEARRSAATNPKGPEV